MPHVSVMIPAFRHGRFLGRTIESVLGQSFTDLDAVVVDDASPDDTREVASRYLSDPRFAYVRNPENLGLVRNWNRCLRLARGPLVMVLASDDVLERTYLWRVDEVFERRPDLGLVHSPVSLIDAAGDVVSEGTARPETHYPPGDDALISLIRNGLSTATTVLRKACAEGVGGYDEAIADTPDIELAARIVSRYGMVDLGGVYGCFRIHDRKWGYMSFLREDALDSYMRANGLIWSHLSPSGLKKLGVDDLERFLAADGAQMALNASIVMLAYSQPRKCREYLRRAREIYPRVTRGVRFWRALLLLALYPATRPMVRRKMKFRD